MTNERTFPETLMGKFAACSAKWSLKQRSPRTYALKRVRRTRKRFLLLPRNHRAPPSTKSSRGRLFNVSKRIGLPVTLKMRHDAHYVESLTSYSGAAVGRMIRLDQIRPNPDQPRKALGDLRELTESVREKGVLEPLLVRYVPREDCFYIISGERRYHAARAAGLREVPCNEKKMVEMFHRIMQGGLTRDEARRERRQEQTGPQRPRPFIFQFEPPSETFKFRIQFKKSHVSRDELISTLRQILAQLEGSSSEADTTAA